MEKFIHLLFFLLLLFEWNHETIASSSQNLQVSLESTDGSLQQVNQALLRYLSTLSLSPGQNVTLIITPPSGVRDAFLQTIMQAAKTVVPQLVPNAGISFKIGASKSMDGTLSNIQLTIILGPGVGGGTGGGGSVSEESSGNIPETNINTICLNLSSSGTKSLNEISQKLISAINRFKPQLNSNQPIQIILDITPPQGSSQSYASTLMSSLRTLLHQIIPSMESSVRANMQGNSDGTISDMKVTITVSASGSGGESPSGENVKLDLSQPGVNVLQTVRAVMSKIVQNPSVFGNGNTPIQMNLQIIPPTGATRRTIQSIIETIKSVLIILMPSAKISIETSVSQVPAGAIKNVNCVINIVPSSSNYPNQINFNLDLSNASSEVGAKIVNILPNIQLQADPILKNGEPVTLNLNIQPPQGANNQFVKKTADTVLSRLQQVFSDKMKVTANAMKNSQGDIVEVILVITIEPNNEVFKVDLSKPGTDVLQQITSIVPNMKKQLNKEQPNGNPTTFTLNIQPPVGSTDQFVKNTMSRVLSSLSQIFPNNRIGVQAKTTKDSQGNITNISLILTIQPNPNAKQPDNEETVNVNLSKPGDNLISTVNNILPRLEDKISREQAKGKPVYLNFNIQTPKDTNEQYSKNTINSLLAILSQKFPYNKIDAKSKSTKDSDGNISDVSLKFTIQPIPNSELPNKGQVVNVDLTDPGSNLIQEVTNVVPNLLNKVKKEEPKGEPVNLELNIRPPKGSTDQFIKNTMNTLVTTLSKIFPNNKVGVKANVSKDSEGNISNLRLVLTINPNPNVEEPKNPEVVNVDLTKPGSNLTKELANVLPTLKNKVNNEGPEEEPISFELNIQPPNGSTDQYVKETINQILKTLTQIFPKNKVGVQAKTTKDSNGSVSNISLNLTIGPNKPEQPETLTVDLTKSGNNLIQEIKNIIPDLQDKISKEQPNGQSVNFDLNIKPPTGSKDPFVRDTMKTVLTTLSQIFPNNKVGVQAKTTKDPQGDVSNMNLVFTIHPNLNTKETNKSETIHVDLTKPGSNLVQEIIDILPEIKHKVEEEQTEGEPVSFDLNIQPPKGSNDQFVKNTMNTILTTLSEIYPKNKVEVQAKTTKDSEGNISDVNFVFTLHPNPNTQNPKEPETINIDLTKPGNNLVQEVTNILPDLKSKVNKDQLKGEPVSFDLNIQPPKGSDDQFVRNSMKTILATLSQIFPENKVTVQAKTTKDPDGNISNVNLVFIIHPKPSTKEPIKKPESINIDLTKAGSNLVQEVTNILPDLKDKISKEQPQDEPVSFDLNIQPPKGSNDQFVKNSMKTILTKISQVFPNNKVSVQAKTTKDPEGNISDVNFVVTVNPNTQTPKEPETTNIDLTKPGTNLVQEVTNILPDLKSKVNKDLPKGEPVSFDLNIQPPKGSDNQFVKNSMKTILATLSQIFPENKVTVQAKTTKGPDGNISNVNLVFIIHPKLNTKEPIKKPESINIDLTKPGSNLVQEVTNILPDLRDKISKEQPQDEPVSFDLNIQPPKGSNDQFVKDSMKTILTKISQVFPNNKVSVQAKTMKDPEGNISDVNFVVTVNPNTQTPKELETTDIDLTKPGTNLVQEVTNILPDLKSKVNKDLPKGEPVSFDLNIQPPKGSDNQFVKNSMKTILATLSQIFPENKVTVQAKTTKGPDGNISNVNLVFIIHPKLNTKEPIKKPESINIDLTKPGSNLVQEVTNILPDLKDKISKEQPQDEPVSFDLNIQPPKGSNDQFVKDSMKTILTKISQVFPNNKVSVQAKTTKDPEGNISDVNFVLTVNPNTQTPKEPKTTNIDLTKPGANLMQEVTNILPDLKNKVNKNQPEGEPVSFDLNIKPPKDSDEQFVKNSMKTVLTTLSQIFPENKVGVQAKTSKDHEGNISNVNLVITVQPKSNTKEPIKKPESINIDLTKPGSNLVQEVTNILPDLKDKISKEQPQDEPVSFDLNIQPPKGSNDQFVKDSMKTILTKLSQIFPNNKVEVRAKTTKDAQGNISNINLEFTIHPSTITEKPIQPTVYNIDLTNPGKNIVDSIFNILPKIKDTLDETKTKNQPVTFDLSVKPAQNSTDQSVKDTTKKILTTLSQIFPENKIKINPTVNKDSKGNITNVDFVLTIEPSTGTESPFVENIVTPKNPSEESETTPSTKNSSEELLLSTTPSGKETSETSRSGNSHLENSGELTTPSGNNPTESVQKSSTTPSGNNPVDELLPTPIPSSGTWTEEVTKTTPSGNYPSESSEELRTTPSGKNPTGKHLPEPTPSMGTWSEEVTKTTPSGKYPSESSELLPTTPSGNNPLEEHIPETTPFIERESKELPQTTPSGENPSGIVEKLTTTPSGNNPVEEIIPKTTPSSETGLEEISKTSPSGNNLSEETGFTTVPSTGEKVGSTPTSKEIETTTQETTEEVSPKPLENINIDISKPGSNIETTITRELPNIVPNVQKELSKDKPTTLSFNIQLPKGSKPQVLTTTTESVIPLLTKYFPDNKISVTTKAHKDPQGNVTDMILLVTLEPTADEKPKQKDVDLDLSRPGTTLNDQVVKKLPDIVTNVKSYLDKGKPITLNFNINPPIGSGNDYLKTTAESLVPILTKYFPNNKINVRTSAQKNPEGYLTNMILEITVEPSKTQQPKEENIDIDLSKPQVTLNDQVNRIVPTVVPKVNDELSKGRPITLNFNIKPPQGSTQDYLQIITELLVPILTKYFPNNKINVKTSAEKNPQGYLSNVVLEINIEPSSQQEPKEKNVDLDLTKPGVTLNDEIDEVIPKIVPNVKNELDRGKPINLSFNIKPPEGSKPSFLQITTESLVPILTKYFPTNKISVKTSAEKNPQGYLTNMLLEITLEPSERQKPKEENVDIDLSRPGKTLNDQVSELLPEVIPNVKNDLEKGHPITLNFNIKPPSGKTQTYLQTITESLVPILTKYFPNNKITVNTNAQKNPEGFLSDVVLQISIEPTPEQIPTEKNVDIDLSKPGVKLNDQIDEVLPKIVTNVKNDVDKGKPITLNFIIKPPTKSTPSFLKTTTDSLIPILTKYFPKNKLNVKTSAEKNLQGYLTNIIIEITVEPSKQQTPKEENIDIDISRPGSELNDEVNKILPKVVPNANSNLNKGHPVTLNFNIKPPAGSNQNYLQTVANSLVPIVTKYFPNNKISMKTSAQKDPLGYLSNVLLEISIEPSSQQNPKEKNVAIDLSIPGVTLNDQVNGVLPNLIPNIKNDLGDGKPVALTFNIKPPEGSTPNYLQTTTESLVPILTKYFPNNKINVKTSAEKNPQGYLTDMILEITIEPSSQPSPKQENVDIDLSVPGVTLNDQVNGVLPNIIPNVKNDLGEGKPVTLNFNIKPPKGSTPNYLQTTTESLVPILTKYFPNNKINVKTSAEKNSQGYLTDMILEITIEPSSQPQPNQENVDIDLSNPLSTLDEQISKVLPEIVPNVRSDLNKGQPVSLKFTIRPPNRSTEPYLQQVANQLAPILSKYFPNNKMNLETSAQKNPIGYLSKIVLVITIQPQSEENHLNQRNVDIDLSRPGTTLVSQVNNMLPTVVTKVESVLAGGQPLTLNFNILPPRHSRDSYLKIITNQLVQILPNFFPTNKINVETKAQKNSQGYLSEIVLVITIQPSSQSQETIDIDLRTPRSSLVGKMNNILPSLVTRVQKNLTQGQAVTLKFKIRPPAGSGQGFLKTAANELVPLLSSSFPNSQIHVKTEAQKDFLGFISNMVLIITIDP